MTQEIVKKQFNGWPMLFLGVFLLILSIAGFVFSVIMLKSGNMNGGYLLATAVILFVSTIFCMAGFFTVEPNEAAVLLLFGKYVGTEKITGFRWANPLFEKKKISLRARNFDSEKLKVNDKKGNPIEISAVIVWRVENTAKAFFEVDDYQEFVVVQSESALRNLASTYTYDDHDGEEITLRSSVDEVSHALRDEIQDRVSDAGVSIVEARINHLAYASEIASAMLQRQQAEAIIAARQKIVDGAVGMVEMALNKLREEGVIELDEERKAAMVSNLLVVLCSDHSTQPVINTGTLY